MKQKCQLALLNKWRGELRPGSLIDARDSRKRWYEAVVKEVNGSTGALCVTFPAWGSEWDEWVPIDSLCVWPRNSVIATGGSRSRKGTR